MMAGKPLAVLRSDVTAKPETPMMVICVQERDGNSILSVRVGGQLIGRVLEDRPHEWIIVREPVREPRYPTLEAVVLALLDRHKNY